MREMELEEGEAPLLYSDDDENIDPDKDFSYIDKKIQDVLGQYRRDFMGEVSAENLGARFGGYGSFLPSYQRSPSTLTHPRNQNHLSSRSPQTMALEGASVNSVQTNGYPPRRPGSSNDHVVQSLSAPGMDAILESSLIQGTDDAVQSSVPGTIDSVNMSVPGISVTGSHAKNQSSGEYASNNESKSLPRNNSLKFRVKVVADGALLHDKSAIYSGLGLDMSPSSSFEDSPSEGDEASPSVEEMVDGSPSCIVEIMTSFHVPSGKLISPLHSSLLHLVEYKSNLENGRPGPCQVVSLSVVHETAPSRKKAEGNRNRKGRQKVNNVEVVKLEEDKYERRTVNSGPGLRWSGGTELHLNDEDVSKEMVDPFHGHSEEKDLPGLVDNSGAPYHSFASNGKSKVEHTSILAHQSLQQIVKDEAKGLGLDFDPHLEDGLVDKQRATRVGDKVQKDKDVSIARNVVASNNVNEDSSTDSIKSLKKRGMFRPNRREMLDSLPLQESGLKDEKEANRVENIPKDSVEKIPKDSVVNGEIHKIINDVSQAIKDSYDEPSESSKGDEASRGASSVDMEVGTKGKKHSSSGGRKKSKKSQKVGLAARFPSPSPAQVETTFHGGGYPSKSREDDMEPEMASRNLKGTSGETEGEPNFMKKEKVMDAKYTIHGPSIGGNPPLSGRSKVKADGKVTGYPFKVGPTPGGDRNNGNLLKEVASTSGAPQPENASVYDAEYWVQCDKCQKWRLLPYGLLPSSLPKKWICKMLDWLPGMNKCSFREDETTNALLVLYRVPASAPENVQPGVSKEGASMSTPVGNHHGVAPRHLSSLESVQNGERIGHGQRQQKDAENSQRNPKKLSQSSVDANSVRKNAEVNPPKMERKREADGDAYRAPKTAKKVLQQFHKEENHAGVVSMGTKDGHNHSTSSSEVSKDLAFKKVKDKGRERSDTMECEVADVSGKKRKIKDEHHSQSSIEIETNKKRFKGSDFYDMEHNAGDISAGCKDNAPEDRPTAQVHGSMQKSVEGTKSAKDPEMGLPVTDSSKSSSTFKVKVKHPSPVGSFSSSPIKVSREHDGNSNKVSELHNEADELFPEKKPKKAVPRDERLKRVKPSTPGNSMTKYDHHDEDIRPKSAGEKRKQMSSAERQSHHNTEKQQKFEVHKDAYRKSASPFGEDRTDSLPQNLASDDRGKRSLNQSDRAESKVAAHSGSEGVNAPRVSQFASTSKKRDGSATTAFDVTDTKLPKPPAHGDARDRDTTPLRVRQSSVDRHGAEKVETSCSSRKDNSHNPAHLLKEATELKHTADRLKRSVSIREAAVVFFQAALKFLLGASYSDLGGTETSRSTRNSPDGVCRSTGDLCEYWAREFEKSNEMAFAALAYKCKEVAYMRVVYSNTGTASRYQQELQNALRTAPQVDSPSSSASDVDNLNNQAVAGSAKDPHLPVVHGNHVMTAGVMPNVVRILSFAEDVSRAMDATRKSQRTFSDAHSSLSKAENAEGITSLKRVLDFSFHDLSGLQRLVSLAMEALCG